MDLELFEEIKQILHDNNNLNNIANLFYKLKPKKYIFQKGLWYYLNKNNEWTMMEFHDNCELMNDITPTIYGILHKFRELSHEYDELIFNFINTLSPNSLLKRITYSLQTLYQNFENDSIVIDNEINDGEYVLEVVKFITENNRLITKNGSFEHIGYMKKYFKTKDDAYQYYNYHNTHLRGLNAHNTNMSDWDPNSKLLYIVRRNYGIHATVQPF